jgi:hypothetical protein
MEEQSHTSCKTQCVLTSIDWDISAKTGYLIDLTGLLIEKIDALKIINQFNVLGLYTHGIVLM